MDVRGVAALVTGGASGLGKAAAQRLAAEGAHVVVVDLPGSAGDRVAKELGGAATFAPADVTDPEAVGRALDAAEAAGPVRVLVHCAGRNKPVRVLDSAGRPGAAR